MQMRQGTLAETQVDGEWTFRSILYGLTGLEVVSRRNNLNIVDRPEGGKVMQAVVGRSEGPITYAGADSDQRHRLVAVADIVLGLLELACGQETGRRNGEDLFSA